MNKFFCGIAEKIKKDKKLAFIVILGAAGIFLLLLSEVMPVSSADSRAAENADIYALQAKTAAEIEKLLRTVEGVGKVKVMVSIDALEERVIAHDSEQSSSEDKTEIKENCVLIKNSGDTDGLVLKTVMPAVRGVAVSCEGGASNTVRCEVTKLVAAGLGISSNRIWVSKMQK